MTRYVVYDLVTMDCVGDLECDELGGLPVPEAGMGVVPNPVGAIESGEPWETSYIASSFVLVSEGVYEEVLTVLPQGDYTLEALPLPCLLTIEGVEYEVTEQPVYEWPVLPEPMEYVVLVDAGVQYLKKEFVVYVAEA